MNSQNIESIKSELVIESNKNQSLKDFSIDLSPNGNQKLSLILMKDTKYFIYIYDNNIDFTLSLGENVLQGKLLNTKNQKIKKLEYLVLETGVYSVLVENKLNSAIKTVILLSTESNDELTKTLANADVKELNDKKLVIFEEESIYINVETMPKFIDPDNHKYSHNGFREFIQKNIIYPEEAKTKKLEGKVYVSFVVDKDGYIKDAKVVRGSHASLNQEALRVVLSSPRWEPGKEKGKPVSVSFTFPIIFSLK